MQRTYTSLKCICHTGFYHCSQQSGIYIHVLACIHANSIGGLTCTKNYVYDHVSSELLGFVFSFALFFRFCAVR